MRLRLDGIGIVKIAPNLVHPREAVADVIEVVVVAVRFRIEPTQQRKHLLQM
jgi:hypothetical protein